MWRGLNRERHVAWQVPFVFGSWHGHKEPPDPLCDGLGYIASFISPVTPNQRPASTAILTASAAFEVESFLNINMRCI